MGFWRTKVEKHPDLGVFYLQSYEYDFDGDLSDIDEPWASYGMDFPTEEAAREFASKHNITIHSH